MKTKVRFMLQPTFLSGVMFTTADPNGRTFQLNSSHPTFAAMRTALLKKRWGRVPKLASIAAGLDGIRNGSVQVKNGVVYYKGRAVHTSLTQRIVKLVQEGKAVGPLLKFMDNLYQNPSPSSINELYDWLMRCSLPITDDGCFMAYKAVTADYKDKHSGTIDNSVGKVPAMPRVDVDPVRANECSYGLHFCSLDYVKSFYGTGDHLLGVKINPKDVVSIPADYNYSKGRTWRYEVVMEIADADPVVAGKADSVIFQTQVLPVEHDRKALLAKVLAHPTIRRAIAKRKLKAKNLRKGTLGRLTKIYASLPVTAVPVPSKLTENPIRVARLQAGLTTTEVAEAMSTTSKTIRDAERFALVGQAKTDAILAAIERAKNARPTSVGVDLATHEDIAAGS